MKKTRMSSLGLSLPLLFGITSQLQAQATPSPSPDQTFFLKERVSLVSESGVIGIAPGTPVRLVLDKGETFSVSVGSTTFDVSKSKVSSDPTEGAQFARIDALQQSAAADQMRRLNETLLQERKDTEQRGRAIEQQWKSGRQKDGLTAEQRYSNKLEASIRECTDAQNKILAQLARSDGALTSDARAALYKEYSAWHRQSLKLKLFRLDLPEEITQELKDEIAESERREQQQQLQDVQTSIDELRNQLDAIRPIR